MKILIIQDDEDLQELDQVKDDVEEFLEAVGSVSIIQPDTVIVAYTDIANDDALKVNTFNIGAAGDIHVLAQGRLHDTLNMLSALLEGVSIDD